VQNIEQVRDGWEQLEALALEAGRDPGSIRVRVFGTAGQWRKRHHVDAFAKVGVEEITIWLQEPDSDGIRRELDLLARELL
jgi:hypothetical protein